MNIKELESQSLCWLALPEIQLYLADGFVKGPRYYMNYTAIKDGKVLFSGNDFSPSPLYRTRSLECIVSCLAFLTVQPRDTDPDYFKAYTLEQMKWAESQECEDLKGTLSDYEDTDGEYFEAAKNTLKACYHEN